MCTCVCIGLVKKSILFFSLGCLALTNFIQILIVLEQPLYHRGFLFKFCQKLEYFSLIILKLKIEKKISHIFCILYL